MERRVRNIQPIGEIGVGRFTTYSGIIFDVLHPTIDMVDIEDIAHSAAMICRFNGHFKDFYSVAQHLVLCWWLRRLGDGEAEPFEYLMHDAHEPYCHDVISPIKKQLGLAYEKLEERVYQITCKKFNLRYSRLKTKTKDNDYKALVMEYNYTQGIDERPFCDAMKDIAKYLSSKNSIIHGSDITNFTCWTPRQAKTVFIEVFKLEWEEWNKTRIQSK